MNFFYILIILILFQGCSFDNKTGIWKNDKNIATKDNDVFKEFEALSSSTKTFDEIISIREGFKFKIASKINNFEWKDIFYSKNNNYKNFKYNDLNELIFKSKKITKYKTNDFILFEDNNLIVSDQQGNIIIFSINENSIIRKFNFYKKRHKKIKKVLNFIVDNNIIYIADNIGYLYAFDYKKNKILWAKNYKIPFRSNLKIFENKLIVANQNNNLFFFNINNGDVLLSIPTEETIVKNKFINNLSLNQQYTYFLNTYGSLYSLDNKKMRINWFINLNQSLDLSPNNLFIGNIIVVNQNIVTVSSNEFTYIINSINGAIIHKKNFTSIVKPLILDNYFFSITSKNLLIAMNLKDGNIIYSRNINQTIADFLKTKKRKVEFKNIIMVNDQIYIFLKNSYVLKFNVKGNLDKVDKLPSKLNTHPILIDGSILYLDYKNKISIID
jgi:outer membrane protein assembly factor BamB